MFVLSSSSGGFSEINWEHQVAVATSDFQRVKKWKTRKGAENFLLRWKGTGVGIEIFSVTEI
jgi:hypothetical protein